MLRVKEVGYDFFFFLSLPLSFSLYHSSSPFPSIPIPTQPSPAQLSPVQSSPNHPGLPVRQPSKLTDRPSESKIPYVSSFPILSLSHTHTSTAFTSIGNRWKEEKKGKTKKEKQKKSKNSLNTMQPYSHTSLMSMTMILCRCR